jgi:hypothetical protein
MPRKLSDIGPRGLLLAHEEGFSYVTETAWRERTEVADSRTVKAGADLEELVRLNVAVAKLACGVFVNLDALAELEEGLHVDTGKKQEVGALRPGDMNVVLHERERFYVVQEPMFQKLDAAASGDAGVLVKRGAVVASIPANTIPTGTFCVLVNWKGLTAAPSWTRGRPAAGSKTTASAGPDEGDAVGTA